MFGILKKIFGWDEKIITTSNDYQLSDTSYQYSNDPVIDHYYHLVEDLLNAKREHNWHKTAKVAKKLISFMPKYVHSHSKVYSSAPLDSHLFEEGARALVITENDTELNRLLKLTINLAELNDFRSAAEVAIEERELVKKILILLSEHSGTLQTEVKDAVNANSGHKVAAILRQLEDAEKIKRIRYKRTYVLGLPGVDIPLPDDHLSKSQEEEVKKTTTEITTTFSLEQTHREKLKPRKVVFDELEYIPLPHSPFNKGKHEDLADNKITTKENFTTGKNTTWKISNVEKIQMNARPDTAYRKIALNSKGLFYIDDLGKAERLAHSAASLISINQSGEVLSKSGLQWPIYKWHANPVGNGIICLDNKGIIHAYDQMLDPLFARSLTNAPEMSELMALYDFDDSNIKEHIGAVSLSPSNDRYLFTVVDCAYVVSTNGNPLWALQFPKDEGWKQVAEATEKAGTSKQIDNAINTLGLKQPFSLNDIKKNYRQLAKKWHPDLNQGSKKAEERFKEISNAVEILSGPNLSTLTTKVKRSAYEKTVSLKTWERDGFSFNISAGMKASEKQISDWLYTTSFAQDGGVFIGDFFGHVIRTDKNGKPIRLYDVGTIPQQIVDTGKYLYILAGTQIYILCNHTLVRVLDTFDNAQLIIGQMGFGVLEKKRFRWFTNEGELVGSTMTKNPIRRIYSTTDGLIIKTRQRCAKIDGAPIWWKI